MSSALGDSTLPLGSGETQTVWYDVSGTQVVAQADDKQFADILRRLFPAYQTSEVSSDKHPSVVISVARRDAGLVITTPAGSTVLSAELDDAVSQVEFALTEAFLALCSDAVQLHASGVVVGNRAILALGDSGRGKSSLALAWSVTGHSVLGDDAVFFFDDGLCHPFKRQFKVDPDVLRANGVEPASTPFWAEGAEDAWFDPESGGGGWASPAPVAVVGIASHQAGAKTALAELSRTEGLNLLVNSELETGCSGAKAFDRLHRVVADARVVEVKFGSAAEAARSLADLAK